MRGNAPATDFTWRVGSAKITAGCSASNTEMTVA